MTTRRHVLWLLAGVLPSLGAAYRTANFVVEAPTPQIAEQFGQAAERYRREKALEWLGQEMPPWPQPCPLHVKVTMGGPGGATQFAFDNGRILGQDMRIEGPLERMVNSVLPHEVTHTVFAYYFRRPVPRWADEGGAVLSEDEIEKGRHDQLVRNILNYRREMPLRRLFSLRDYPSDVMVLYAEGFSVANFLVSSSDKRTFLAFVAQGMQGPGGWDQAVRTYYRYGSVEELEQAWLTHLRNTRRQQPDLLAKNTGPANAEAASRVTVRQTAPPNAPTLAAPRPIFRGQAPGPETEGEWVAAPRSARVPTPAYLPDYDPSQSSQPAMPYRGPSAAGNPNGRPPAPAPEFQPPMIRLEAPQFDPPPYPRPGGFPENPGSPVGYPR